MFIELTDRANAKVLLNIDNADVISDSGDGHTIIYYGKNEMVSVLETVDEIREMIAKIGNMAP